MPLPKREERFILDPLLFQAEECAWCLIRPLFPFDSKAAT
jgi:hypothetical protein